jgi:preprotein translocase subunit SecG
MRLKFLPTIIIILLFTLFSLVSSISSEENEDWNAQINARVIGDIQTIDISSWTEIEVELTDSCSINWPRLNKNVPTIIMEIIWPFNQAFPQPVKRFLGPTSFKLEPEIVRGNPQGWHTKISPSSIEESVTGRIHNITLSVQADDAYLDNSVVIGIKVTRIDTLGGVIGHSYVYVPVKASPTNFIKMRTLEESTKQAPLKSLVYFTLDIVNEGFYRDVFEFEIEEENGLMALMDQQAVTIHPGETKRVTLEILTPEKLYDFGTPNELKIYVRSSGDETKTLVGNLVVITKGIYISPLLTIITIPLTVFFIIGYISFKFFKDKQDKKLYGKPDKPWNIPAEQKYLQELKEKDTKQYKHTINMMKQEHQSAIRYWKNSRSSKKQTSPSKNRFSSPKKESRKIKGITKKSMNYLKKLFTVPEEEKQKKHNNTKGTRKESIQKEKQSKNSSPQKTKQEKNDYDIELNRIKQKQRKKQFQRATQQKKKEKQKAIHRVKKYHKKQKKKLRA